MNEEELGFEEDCDAIFSEEWKPDSPTCAHGRPLFMGLCYLCEAW